MKTKLLNQQLWAHLDTIIFEGAADFSDPISAEFLALEKKFNQLFNKVLEAAPEAIQIAESINRESDLSAFSVFLPLLWDTRIKQMADLKASRATSYWCDPIKQKIDALDEKIQKIANV